MTIIITFGTYDLFHIGHLKLLQRASKYGDSLIVGVSSDFLNYKKKNKNTVFTQEERLEIVNGMSCVDNVFIEESLEKKKEYIIQYKADILVMGDDWEGKFDYLEDSIPGFKVIYLPRTNGISTTETIVSIKQS